ncbi:MAG: hypothetical protein WC979_04755 [Candidatus Pacearchaeota archaeon]|jgi:hypothetical protein
MKFKEIFKNNWDLIPVILFAILFFAIDANNAKLFFGGIYFILLGIMDFTNKGSFSGTNKKLNFYTGILLITLGIFSLLTIFLLPQFLTAFIIIFIFIVLFEALLFYLWGPDSWFKYYLYILFIIPIIGLLISLFSGIYTILLENNFDRMTFILISLGIMGFILMVHLFYWPLDLYKKNSNRKIIKYVNKINFGAFILTLIGAIFYIVYFWADQNSAMEKLFLIISTITALEVTVFTILGVILSLFKEKGSK